MAEQTSEAYENEEWQEDMNGFETGFSGEEEIEDRPIDEALFTEEAREEPEGEETKTAEPQAVDTESGESVPAKTFLLKHYDGDREVTLDELKTLAQKGLDYENVKLERDKFRDSPERLFFMEMAETMGKKPEELVKDLQATQRKSEVEKLLSDGVSREIAEELIERRYKEREAAFQNKRDKMAKEEAQRESRRKDAAEQKKLEEIKQFLEENPDIQGEEDIPKEVLDLMGKKNLSLSSAYDKYQLQKLREQMKVLEQNQKNKQAAVGDIKGDAKGEKLDPFLAGFMGS